MNTNSFFTSMQRKPVLDSEMAWFDSGVGDPVVFLHGNPTSSYMWRNIIPHVSTLGRCLAPDLIGMGRSAPSPRRAYRLADHAAYLDAWFDALQLERVVLVLQDWGVPLGLSRARRYPDSIAGICYMEGPVLPRRWSDLPPGRDKFFRMLRSRDGEKLVLEENFFLEKMFFGGLMQPLSEEDRNVYRSFSAQPGEARLPMLVWPREIVFDGDPADNAAELEANVRWLSTSPLPKLFVNAEPGNSIVGETRDFCRTLPNQREITVPGHHYVPEDAPAAIGAALAEFVRAVRQGG